jgi:hypothetical protein
MTRPRQPGKAQAAIAKVAQTVTRPAGKDIDWEKVRAVGAIIGAIAVIHGLKNRPWRYAHSAAAGLAIGAAAASRIKNKYVEEPPAAENKPG